MENKITLTPEIKSYIDNVIERAKQDSSFEELKSVGYFDTELELEIIEKYNEEQDTDYDEVSSNVRNYIQSAINSSLEEMARIASGLKLADDYKTALAAQPENIRASTRMQKIIAFLKDSGSATLKDIAMALYNRPDTASVNQLVRALKQAGIVADTGLVSPKAEKTPTNAPGIKGRPKVTNDEIKMLGGGALRKFAKGETDFTPEEIDFITQLYNAATAVSESEIAEITKEDSINEARWNKLAGLI